MTRQARSAPMRWSADMIDLELFRLICRVEALGTKGDELGRALRAARRISFAMLPSWRKKELDA